MSVVSSVNKIDNEKRLAVLRKKIHDPKYMDDAIQRIAGVLSKNIVEIPSGNKEFKYGA
jgi:hypothetical protein